MREALVAEFIGTFFLVFAGTGALAVDALTHTVTHVGVSLVFGLVVAALVYALGHVSGAHFNPAVTLGFWVARAFPGERVAWYVISQILGAIAASILIRLMFGSAASAGVTLPASSVSTSFVLELAMTSLLVIVVMGSAVHGRATKGFAGIAIGSAIALDAIFGGPISGASMNPARSLGPACIAGIWHDQWIYVVAPLAGALLAVAVYRILGDADRGVVRPVQ
ncbi:MAG: MIP family channel protein [Candidatus Eremiobacteraeota bacterium]|nr:MIP family channel protein [Candidatus Eremiobacteraeota bacterium]MBV8222203.1 MIP family channel protein [Candidatus Eremiobacteraeota bacterium]MBV8282154.1 MIP family channel protein [Candidatus Eremiobacteraeota bacterium]